MDLFHPPAAEIRATSPMSETAFLESMPSSRRHDLCFHHASCSFADPCPEVAEYINHTLELHHFLTHQSDLSPRSRDMNQRLSAFVAATMKLRPHSQVKSILDDKRISDITVSLRGFLRKAEYEMERFSSLAMTEDGLALGCGAGYASFDDFIYRQNYEALIRGEMASMGWPRKQPALDRKTESIAFIGAGPLPMSAILLHLYTGHPVTCIDSDATACRLGQTLIHHLSTHFSMYRGLAENIHYVQASGQDYDYITHPIIYLASLVEDKDPVIMRILRTSDTGCTLVVRSAEGLGSLLYEPHVCAPGINNYNLYFSGQTNPNALAINTSLVFKMPSGKMRQRNKIDFSIREEMTAPEPKKVPMWRTRSGEHTI